MPFPRQCKCVDVMQGGLSVLSGGGIAARDVPPRFLESLKAPYMAEPRVTPFRRFLGTDEDRDEDRDGLVMKIW